MIQKIKELIKENISKKGYRLILRREYIEFIKGTEELYEIKFKRFPRSNGKRENLIANLLGTGLHEAFYLIHYLNESLKKEGDVCEFGVAQGATSALIANEIINTKKNLWLYDSFKGLPRPTKEDVLKDDIFNLGSMSKYEGTMSSPSTMVIKKLKNIRFPSQRTKIVPGFITNEFEISRLPNKVCFAYLDFDFYEPTLVVLDRIDSVLVRGGFLMIDDYDFFSTGIKKAVEDFLKDKKGKYDLILPTTEAGHFCILKKREN